MTTAIQDYVKAIYLLSTSGTAATTKRISESVGTSLPAVSKMLRLLADKEMVVHKPYYGATLTEKGEACALEVLRHHRLLECYLMEHLGFSEEEVHEQAEVLEHHISEEFEDRIASLLNNPETCPHGQPIPPKAPTVLNRRGRN